jgi:hypothetical protein
MPTARAAGGMPTARATGRVEFAGDFDEDFPGDLDCRFIRRFGGDLGR